MTRIFIFLITLLPFSVFSQSNYYPGYVLKNNGDTLKGYINYHEWTTSPHLIDFKLNKADNQAQHFDPISIKGFRVNDYDTYTSYAGIISAGQTNFSNLHHGIDTGKIVDTVFLKQIATGRYISLYYQSDIIKTRYFAAETDGVPVELNYYEYINDLSAVTKSAIFKGQLLLYANKFRPGNDKLISTIEQSSYDEGDLQNIVNEINEKIKHQRNKSPQAGFSQALALTILQLKPVIHSLTAENKPAPRYSQK